MDKVCKGELLKQAKSNMHALSKSQRRRKQDIIQAAIKLFDRDGFEAARMVDIAKEAEVAKGTLYLYFENKIALLAGVVDAVIVPTVEVAGEVNNAQSGSAKEILETQLQIIARRMASPEMKILLRLMISAQAKHPKVTEFYYENVIQPGIELINRTLKYGVKTGEFRKEIADLDPVILVGANVYTAVWKILFESFSPLDTEKLLKLQIDLILNGLLVKN